MADPTKVSHMHLSLFPMASLVGHQPIAAVNIKKKEKHTQILLCTCIFTHIPTLWPYPHIPVLFSLLHAHKQSWSFLYQSFTQCWERKRYGRAGYRRTQAICEQSRAIPTNPVSSPVILQDTHAQTLSPVPERLPFCPLCLLTGLLWGYHSNLNYFVFTSQAPIQTENYTRMVHLTSLRKRNVTKQTGHWGWVNRHGKGMTVSLCVTERAGFPWDGLAKKKLAENHLELIVMMWLSG